jgi:hypothetical protein
MERLVEQIDADLRCNRLALGEAGQRGLCLVILCQGYALSPSTYYM